MALSAIALASCTNDEVIESNPGNAIAFNVSTGVTTRVAATTGETIKDEGFKVSAFTEGEETGYMTNLQVDYKEGSWGYEGTMFWPAAKLDFYSVSPQSTNVTFSASDTRIVGYTINEKAGDQIDLLYAVNMGETRTAKNDAPVNINFRHALSQIVFRAKNTNKNLEVIIDGVKVMNVNGKGNFAYPKATTSAGSTDDETTIGTWSNQKDPLQYGYEAGVERLTLNGVKDGNLTTTDRGGVFTGAMFLLPQKLTPWDLKPAASADKVNGAYFFVKCKINSIQGGTSTQIWPKDVANTNPEWVAIPVNDGTWDPGKKYTYTFIFGEGGGYVDPTKPEGGEPVLVPVSFNVSVDDFTDGFTDIDMKYNGIPEGGSID